MLTPVHKRRIVRISTIALILLALEVPAFGQDEGIPTSEQIRESIAARLFEQGPFIASWQIQRQQQPDVDAFVRGRKKELDTLFLTPRQWN